MLGYLRVQYGLEAAQGRGGGEVALETCKDFSFDLG